MCALVMQYVLVVLLVIGLSYFVYLIRDKGNNISEDYFGIAYTILGSLQSSEATPKNLKSILRIVSSAVENIEMNYKNEDNDLKEEKALILVRAMLDKMNFKRKIEDDKIRQLIHLCAAFAKPTNKTK